MKTLFFPFNKNETEVMNIWKSYMRTTGWRIIWKKVIAVIDATFAAAERKPEKNLSLHEIRTLDLCGTGAALYQLPTNWLISSIGRAAPGWGVALRSCNTLPTPDPVQMPFAYHLREKKNSCPLTNCDHTTYQFIISQTECLKTLPFEAETGSIAWNRLPPPF